MSWQANGWTAFLLDPYKPDQRAARLRPAHVLVLTMLAIHHNHHEGYAYAQLKRLAAETRLSVREVVRVLNDLEEWDIVVISYGELPRGKRGNLYFLVGLDDLSQAGPRRRLGGRPISDDSVSTGLDDPETAGSCQKVDLVDDPETTFQLTELNSPLITGSKPDSTLRVEEPVLEPVARALDEAPPQRAEHMEPEVGDVPPRWQELVPGVHHGLPDGKGEVVLLKARCPRCGHAFPIGDLDSGEIPEHDCQPVFAPIDPRPRSPGNLGGHLRRARHRSEPIPPEVHAELARMAGNRPTPEQIAADLERVGLARAGPSPEPSAPSTNGHSVPAGGTTRDEDRDDRT